MPRFNVGDRVKCIRGARTPGGNEVIEGRIYVVTFVDLRDSGMRVEGGGRTIWLNNRFELVAPPVVAEAPRETSVRYVVINRWDDWRIFDTQHDAQEFADQEAEDDHPVKAMKKVTLTINTGA